MKESPTSMRVFFIIVGLLGVLGGGLGVLGSLALMALSGMWGVVLLIMCAASLVVSLAYVYCGVQLPGLLETRPDFVVKVILAGLTLNVTGAIVGAMSGGGFSIGRTAFSVLISLYLLNSVKRLAANPGVRESDTGFSRL